MKQILRHQKEAFERRLITEALVAHPNVKDAATHLGVSWTHLYRRIEKLGIARHDQRVLAPDNEPASEPT